MQSRTLPPLAVTVLVLLDLLILAAMLDLKLAVYVNAG